MQKGNGESVLCKANPKYRKESKSENARAYKNCKIPVVKVAEVCVVHNSVFKVTLAVIDDVALAYSQQRMELEKLG